MKLIHTRKVLSEYVKKERNSKQGRPTSDLDLKRVEEELTYFERKFKFYKIVLGFVLAVLLLLTFHELWKIK